MAIYRTLKLDLFFHRIWGAGICFGTALDLEEQQMLIFGETHIGPQN